MGRMNVVTNVVWVRYHPLRWFALLVLVTAFGCSDDDPEPGGTSNDVTDSGRERPDASLSDGSDDDSGSQDATGSDIIGSDVGLDSADSSTAGDADATGELDTAELDTAEAVDLNLQCDASIADIRAASIGVVSLDVCEVLVTYVNIDGFFIQNDQGGPAIYVFERTDWSPTVAVGDVISTRVTEVGEYENNLEVLDHEALLFVSHNNNVDTVREDISPGGLPSDDNEHEIVQISGTVASLDRYTVLLDYGTATGVELIVDDYSWICEGASVVLNAVVFDTLEGPHFESADFANDLQSIDPAGCEGANAGRAPAAGELLLNEFLEEPAENSTGDANCDGSGSRVDDEFLELINVSDATLQLRGATIWDDFGLRHRFQPSIVLQPGEAIVVYGGGTPSCALEATHTIVSTTDQLGLSNHGDVITLRGSDEGLLLEVTYLDDVSEESYTLSPDLDDTDVSATGIGGYEAHSAADGGGDGSLFSPGTAIDGTTLFPIE